MSDTPKIVDIFTGDERTASVKEDDNKSWREQLVTLLKDMLERAESGDLTSVIIVGRSVGGRCVSGFTGNVFDDPFMHVGMMELVRHRILNDLIENEELDFQ